MFYIGNKDAVAYGWRIGKREMRRLARELNYEPFILPKSNRKTSWKYIQREK
jgi:hypothetical protein